MNMVSLPERHNYFEAYLTLRCNLGCSYCINERSGEVVRSRQELSAEQWAAGLNRIDYGEVPLTLGGGEPSMHKGFYELLDRLRPDINVDLLTNLSFDLDEFLARTSPDRFNRCRLPAYKAIRVSYHVEKMVPAVLMERVLRLQNAGYNIGIFGLNHPHNIEHNMRMAEMACSNRVFFFVKDFLGEFNGKLFGHFNYPEALAKGEPQSVRCRTREVLIGPGGGIYRCHRDLYLTENPVARITDENLVISDQFRPCDHFGHCNPCDVKLKTNRYLEMGHCSVDIEL
jgi:hypothetical protein